MPRCTASLLWLTLALAAACKAKPADRATPPATAPSAAQSASTPGKPGASTPGKPGTPPPRLPDPAADAAELEARSVAAMQHLADALAGDAGNCDKLAGDLKVFVTGNKPLLVQLFAQQQQPSEGQATAFAQRPAAIAVAHKLQSAMAMCAANPAVVAAMKEFPAE